jgi:CSLREA domain-containing protein
MSLLLLALVVVFHPAFAQTPTLITVNTIDDELNSDGDCSLREAITAANTNAAVDACAAGVPGADTIGFDVTGTITLGSSLPAINDSLTIAGPGVANLTISGNNAVRALTVNAGIKLSVQDLTIANGNAIDGGGIYNNFGVVELVNSTLSGNKADYYGGGIYSNGTLTIRSSTLSGNSASPYFGGLGGGIYIRGAP